MKPEFCILHCSDTPDDPSSEWYHTKLEHIRKWHTDPVKPKNWKPVPNKKEPTWGRGWRDIGYHWVIERDGALRAGRPENKMGAHCAGHNEKSLAICLIGRNVFTDAQLSTLFSIYLQIKVRHRIDAKQWGGHYEFDAGKTCPNLDMDDVRERLSSL